MTTRTKLALGILGAAVVAGILYYTLMGNTKDVQAVTFNINGEPITLVDGKYETETAPGSASKTTTEYFGNSVEADFNGDGKEDQAFIVTQTTGGSGTFFYLATTLGGEAQFLGDRIKPQSTNYIDGKVVVNYAERNEGDAMTEEPSVGVSKYFEIQGGTIVPVQTSSEAAASSTPSTGKKMAFSQLALQGGTYKCSVNQHIGDMTAQGTVYMDKGLIRGEFTVNAAGQNIDTVFIMRDGFTYAWNSMMPATGFKIKNNSAVSAPTGSAGANGSISAQTPTNYLEQIGDYNCEDWTADTAKFTIPSTVTFQTVTS